MTSERRKLSLQVTASWDAKIEKQKKHLREEDFQKARLVGEEDFQGERLVGERQL